jgi:Carboxymuconolactone decarboxylase family.
LRIARESGVTEDELNEVAYIALLMGGTPALMESIKLKKYLDETR